MPTSLPVTLLVVSDIGLGVGDIAALGVRRISVGGALALAGWGAFMRAAQTLKSKGSFSGLSGLAPYPEVNDFLAAELHARQARRI
jgi:2-methylisocitrate lyase-like PEP mutase family enzyme